MSDLRWLLARPDLGLDLVVAGDPARLATPLDWVHSSDLADPTPWLEAGQLVLTNGIQFTADRPPDAAAAYVDRLVDSGIVALGFAVGVVHDALPDDLADACRRAGLPLVAMPATTPFLSVSRALAEERERIRRERLEWSLAAQRAVARAALHPDGLPRILDELSNRLACWAVLFDASGGREAVSTSPQHRPPGDLELVAGAARDLLRRGRRASRTLALGEAHVVLQSIGSGGRLRGVLAVGTATGLDDSGVDLVGSVVALASIALEQRRSYDEARRGLRGGFIRFLLATETVPDAAQLSTLWSPLPLEPLVVVHVPDPAPAPVLAELESLEERSGGLVFAAEHDEALWLFVSEELVGEAVDVLTRGGCRGGLSTAVDWAGVQQGATEARLAADRADARTPFPRFELFTEAGLWNTLVHREGLDRARRLLAPILALPPAERNALLLTAATWFEANCSWDLAARRLRVHRHTMRNRLERVAELTGIPIDAFAGRAELWAAIRLVDQPGARTVES